MKPSLSLLLAVGYGLFTEREFQMGDITSALKTRDKKKSQKRKKQKSNTGKFRRRKIDLEKYADSH